MTGNIVTQKTPNAAGAAITVRAPQAEDGPALYELVAACAPLDPNSRYCNLLHCTHFGASSVAAVRGDELVGFVSGYRIPDTPRTLFIWQVAVAPTARRIGLGLRMLNALLERDSCHDVHSLHTTITPDNHASRALFTALARARGADLTESVWFESERHFRGAHADELLLRIGPFRTGAGAS